MMKMYSDLINALDNSRVTIFVMIGHSAAYDTIDIPMVLQILQEDFGIKDTPFKGVESYLTERTTTVIVDHLFTVQNH